MPDLEFRELHGNVAQSKLRGLLARLFTCASFYGARSVKEAYDGSLNFHLHIYTACISFKVNFLMGTPAASSRHKGIRTAVHVQMIIGSFARDVPSGFIRYGITPWSGISEFSIVWFRSAVNHRKYFSEKLESFKRNDAMRYTRPRYECGLPKNCRLFFAGVYHTIHRQRSRFRYTEAEKKAICQELQSRKVCAVAILCRRISRLDYRRIYFSDSSELIYEIFMASHPSVTNLLCERRKS